MGSLSLCWDEGTSSSGVLFVFCTFGGSLRMRHRVIEMWKLCKWACHFATASGRIFSPLMMIMTSAEWRMETHHWKAMYKNSSTFNWQFAIKKSLNLINYSFNYKYIHQPSRYSNKTSINKVSNITSEISYSKHVQFDRLWDSFS